MDTMDKTQRLNRTIPCANCGEMYSISYKRCPFCGGSVRKRQDPVPTPAAPKMTTTSPIPKEVKQMHDLPEDFSADIDWTPELDDGSPKVPTTRGGKRLQKQRRFSWGRLLAFVLSLVIVVAAAYIVVTRVVPMVQERLHKDDSSQGSPLPSDGEPKDDASVAFRLLDTKVTLTQKGESKQLTAVYEGEGDMGDLKWESSDTQIVMVSGEGKLTALRPGTATVTAIRKDDTKAQCEVTCLWDDNATTTSLYLNKVDFTIGAGEPNVTLKVIGTSDPVTWSVENQNVVTVSETGVVKYVGKGKTKVLATVGGQTLTCVVYGK